MSGKRGVFSEMKYQGILPLLDKDVVLRTKDGKTKLGRLIKVYRSYVVVLSLLERAKSNPITRTDMEDIESIEEAPVLHTQPMREERMDHDVVPVGSIFDGFREPVARRLIGHQVDIVLSGMAGIDEVRSYVTLKDVVSATDQCGAHIVIQDFEHTEDIDISRIRNISPAEFAVSGSFNFGSGQVHAHSTPSHSHGSGIISGRFSPGSGGGVSGTLI